MSSEPIETTSLRLVPQTPAQARRQLAQMSAEDRAQVSPEWEARVATLTTIDPWTLGFILVHRVTGAVVGSCGFKAPPAQDGVVEIAYGIEPEHRGKGYATEAAEGLMTFAVCSGRVRLIRAHTLAETNASARVLTKCGFRCVGQVVEPEDGLVWRWERLAPQSAGSSATPTTS